MNLYGLTVCYLCFLKASCRSYNLSSCIGHGQFHGSDSKAAAFASYNKLHSSCAQANKLCKRIHVLKNLLMLLILSTRAVSLSAGSLETNLRHSSNAPSQSPGAALSDTALICDCSCACWPFGKDCPLGMPPCLLSTGAVKTGAPMSCSKQSKMTCRYYRSVVKCSCCRPSSAEMTHTGLRHFYPNNSILPHKIGDSTVSMQCVASGLNVSVTVSKSDACLAFTCKLPRTLNMQQHSCIKDYCHCLGTTLTIMEEEPRSALQCKASDARGQPSMHRSVTMS